MDSDEERNILLIGKVGAGKSHIGNGILGLKNYFATSWTSCKRPCEYGSATRNAKRYRVFETPGICSKTDTDVLMDVQRVLLCTSRGFHAIVFVLSTTERITFEDVEIFKSLNKIFGIRGIYDFMILAFTKMDDDYQRLDEMIECTKGIKDLDMTCQSRRVIFGNNMQEIPTTYLQRFDKELENLVLKNRRNGNEYIRHENYKKASEILTQDKTDYMKKHPGVSSDVAMDIVRIKAALGKSPREEKLREIMCRSLGGCSIF